MPDVESHTVAAAYEAHWLESVHASQAFVTTLHTGKDAMHPSVEQVSWMHWLSTHVRPWPQDFIVARPTCLQSSAETQHAFGFAFVEHPAMTSTARSHVFTLMTTSLRRRHTTVHGLPSCPFYRPTTIAVALAQFAQ
jgi:hypothetical protein